MRLSIIIPAYNAEPYLGELVACLSRQMVEGVEVIIVDDGSEKKVAYKEKWLTVINKKNGGVSTARNKGLDVAKGEYIQFIDADDLVPDYFLSRLLKKIDEEHPDIIEFSWKSLSTEGVQHNIKLNSNNDRLTNPSSCTRTFKRSVIGETRYNTLKDSTEDEDFSRKIGFLDKDTKLKRAVIPEYMYYYRTAVPNSKIKKFKKGLMKTKRVVYYYPHVVKEMAWLLDEIKKEDETNEVWLLTKNCDIPELKKYCQVSQPFKIWGHIKRGEPCDYITVIEPPLKTQVVLYVGFATRIGGIETFLYNFACWMKDYYDIVIVYDDMDYLRSRRLAEVVRTIKNNKDHPIQCDTLICNRLTDKIPSNITYKKCIQLCHCCKQKILTIPTDRDMLVTVSQTSKDSWGEAAKDARVIHNLSSKAPADALLLVSATRIGAPDKGNNDKRMIQLANMMNDAKIPYVWLVFSQRPLTGAPANVINAGISMNVEYFLKKADYLVQLSDEESWCLSVNEALLSGCPVIVTPFEAAREMGVKDGENGYIVPFDMRFDVKKLLKVPRKFKFTSNDEAIIDQWREILGDTKPEGGYEPYIPPFTVRALKEYRDIVLNRIVKKNEELYVDEARALDLERKGLCKIVEG